MTSVTWSDAVGELQREAALKRTRGDALRRQGNESGASTEFRAGVGLLDSAIQVLSDPRWNRLPVQGGASSVPAEQLSIAKELVEVYGARGGLLRRLGESSEALDSYALGAGFERRYVPQSSYNRTNEIKYGLLTGLRSLVELGPEIAKLERHLTTSLGEKPELGDSGWAWADLGDLRALLGDDEGAARAYRTFIDKAKPTAPRTTLDVLGSILEVLRRTNDERAAAVLRSLEFVRGRLDLR
jgi:tetratricopeptide (TPR) repeat protein